MPRRPSPARVAARYAYMPGVRDPNGWEPGHVEPDSEVVGYGSQVPPAHGQDGELVDVEVDGKVVKNASMRRTAGEVRFIKDRSGDANQWGWGSPGPSEREIQPTFTFNAKHLKPLAKTLRSALMALGHCTSAYNRFVKIKSRNVSPDGALGGKGYIQKIPDMRRQLMNCIEALSALTDTIYDEMHAPHWNPSEDTLDSRDRDEVKEIIEDAEEIKDDPEAWAEEQEEEMDDGMGKTARRRVISRRARTLRRTHRRLA